MEDLDKLSSLKILRAARTSGQGRMQLHGFCDASQIAYEACIYLHQQISPDEWSVHLICAN